MGDFQEAARAHLAFDDQRLNPQTPSAGLGSTLLAFLAGAYVVFKALELLGFPVWLWVHMAMENVGTLRLLGAKSASSGNNASGATQHTDTQRGGNVLSSVFGLNSSSLLQKGVRGVTGALSKGSSHVPPGLGNWDNSCYQNSVIQGLASLPSLQDYLSKTTSEYETLDTETTNGALFDMISKLNDPNNCGSHFWIRGKLKSMSTFQQQDAQEYYSKILDALDKEVQGASSSKRRSSASWLEVTKNLGSSPVNPTGIEDGQEDEKKANPETAAEPPKMMPNPLDGLLAQRVGCVNCGYSEGLQLIPFNCVTVSLGRNYIYDVRECLDDYTTLEYIDGVECAKCSLLKYKATLAPLVAAGAPFQAKLQAVEEALEDEDFDDKTLVKKFNILKKNWVQSTKSRQAVIARAPKALVLHINRSIFDEMTGAQYKNTASVGYPQVLDLGNWCLGSRPSESHLPDNAPEEWPRDPTRSMLGDARAEPIMNSPFQYQLRAAVTHFGTHGNGHYVCYRPYPSNSKAPSNNEDGDEGNASGEQWYRYSDDTVYAVQESEAHQRNVFMLFYERVDQPSETTKGDPTTVEELHPVEEDLPLPPADLGVVDKTAVDDTAADIPLPGDDDEFLPEPPISPEAPTPPIVLPEPSTQEQRPATVFPAQPLPADTSTSLIPPPEQPISLDPLDDAEPSEADSEDPEPSQPWYSSQADALPTPRAYNPLISPGPHRMRTAGESHATDGGNRSSLPMVTAL